MNRDDELPGIMAETVVKRVMTVARAWGGDDIKVTYSVIDLETYADRSAMGACVCTIRRRSGYDDRPTRIQIEFGSCRAIASSPLRDVRPLHEAEA